MAELDEAGIEYESVTFDGRDGRLVIIGSDADATRAAALVGDIDGVRSVEWASTAGGDSATGATSPPTTSTAATTAPLPATTTSTTEAPAATSTTTTSTTLAAPSDVASLVADLRDGRLSLEGVLPDATALAGLTETADLIYAPLLDINVELDNSVPPASWMPAAARAVSVLPIIGNGRLELTGDEARLTGTALDAVKVAQIEGALAAILGAGVTLDTDVEVTGQSPPRFEAQASPDGTIALSGEMPDDEVIAGILGAAVAAYGQGNVTNEMVVGSNTGRNFSVFRVPLIFPLFRQIPQWELTIIDDAISGNLRGGATYPVGSAEVTPELEALLQVGAGILLRNPTLSMVIEGHTDSTGSNELNQRLSEARAENAAAFLVDLGIDPARLEAVGFGETQPIADNGTAEGRAQNRRVEFRLRPTGGQ